MSSRCVSNSLTIVPIEIVDKVLGLLDYGSLFFDISLVCKEWKARPLVQEITSIYTKERKACLNEGYPLDLINSLLKHSISIWRLPVLKTIGHTGAYYIEHIGLELMINSMNGEPTSLLRFREPNEHEFGLVMRIKCFASIKFKELEPIIPSDLHPLVYREHMWPVKSYPEHDVFETGMCCSNPNGNPSAHRILFLTIYDRNKKTWVSTNHWSSDKHAFMNYAYALKGIDKEITHVTNLSQFMEEMLVGDGLFQIYSPPDQIDPPLIPPKLLETSAKVDFKKV